MIVLIVLKRCEKDPISIVPFYCFTTLSVALEKNGGKIWNFRALKVRLIQKQVGLLQQHQNTLANLPIAHAISIVLLAESIEKARIHVKRCKNVKSI